MSIISVICTVKNGEQTIKGTIESVLNQSIQNWELIVIDDGSRDSTVEILGSYTRHDERIRVFETAGIGRGKSLNLAVSKAKGALVVNIDADDLMHPQLLEIQRSIIESNPKYFLICSDARIFFEEVDFHWDEVDMHGVKVEDVSKKNLLKNRVNHSSVMMKNDTLKILGKYDESRKSQFDYELWLRAFKKGFLLGKIDRKLVAKRIHKNQFFEQKRRMHLLRSVRLQTKYIFISKNIHLLLFPFARLVLGALPFNIRQKINVILKI